MVGIRRRWRTTVRWRQWRANEATARWNKGLASTLLLGAVYGMFNEAISTKGFFDPHFYAVVGMDLMDFGRWGNINVLWALGMTMVHVVISITVPITLTDALFPGTRGRLGNKTLSVMLLIFLATVAFAAKHMNPYVPGWKEWLFIVALMALLIIAARFIQPTSLSKRMALPRDLTLFASGFVGLAVFFLIYTAFHKFVYNPVLNVLALLCLLAAYAWLLLKLPDHLPVRSKVALATGIYSLPTLASILSGRFPAAAFAIAVMVAAWVKTKHAESGAAGSSAAL